MVSHVCQRLAGDLAKKDVEMDIDVAPYTIVQADRTILQSAVEQLVLHAFDATPPGGVISIIAWKGHDVLELEVADDGADIDENWRRVGSENEASSTAHDTKSSIDEVCRIAEAHGGEVFASNCPQGGAAFTIRIPAIAQKRAA
jgi:signal transduction histidine kinase